MTRMIKRWCGRLPLPGVMAAIVCANLALPAHASPRSAVLQPVQIQGVAVNSVSGTPSPAYVTGGVSDDKINWIAEALEIAWQGVPLITGLPRPTATIPLYVFGDQEEAQELAPRMGQSAPPFAACSSANDGDRALKCNSTTLCSRDRTIDLISHELTHQFVQGDIDDFRGVETWYNEGLAEYVQSAILGAYSPAYAERAWLSREREVVRALHNGTYLRLASLTTNEEWVDWGRLHGTRVQYAEASLAVRALVAHVGVPMVAEVVRHTDPQHPFEQAFVEVLGQSVAEFDAAFEDSLRVELLRPGRVLYRDEFSDPESGWGSQWSAVGQAQFGYVDGGYDIVHVGTCTDCGTFSRSPLAVDDFVAVLDGHVVEPTADAYLFVDFRMQDDGGRYRFGVEPSSQQYWLRRREGGEWTTIFPTSTATAIHQGAAINRLEVRAQGPELVLLINGQQVAQLLDAMYEEGGLAIGVGNQDGRRAEARFTQLEVANAD